VHSGRSPFRQSAGRDGAGGLTPCHKARRICGHEDAEDRIQTRGTGVQWCPWDPSIPAYLSCRYCSSPILFPAASAKRIPRLESVASPAGKLFCVGTMYSTKPPVTTRLAPVTVGVTVVIVFAKVVIFGDTT